jgi:hypothetical protein
VELILDLAQAVELVASELLFQRLVELVQMRTFNTTVALADWDQAAN